MGVTTVKTNGSFGSSSKFFEAINHGHAHAVAEAIRYLSETVLPAAIEKDHRLHDEGIAPKMGFDRPNH